MPTRSPLRFGSLVLMTAAVTCGVGVLAACAASGTDRGTFTEDSPVTSPVPTAPEQSTPPTKTTQSGPANTGDPDASVPQPDAPDTCKRTAPSNKCGLDPQCGCTLAETCDVADSMGNVACIVAGKAVMGAPCLATAGCGLGLTCVFGTCHSFCSNPGSACTAPKTGGCQQVTASGGAAIPNLSVCRVACDLRDVNACGGTTAAGTGVCQVDSTGNTDCAAGGTATAGQACSPTADCGPGNVCTTVGAATAGTCRKWCRVGTNDCGGTAVCGGFGTKIIVNGVEHGACP